MFDPNVLLVALGMAIGFWMGSGINHAIHKAAHGVKVAACKVHLAHCETKEPEK